MRCESARELLGAYADEELGPDVQSELREHLAGCADCSESYDHLLSLKQKIQNGELFWTAPPELHARIRESLAPRRRSPARAWAPWLATAAGLVLVISAVTVFIQNLRSGPGDVVAQQIASSHVRALVTDHLMDVPSSDRHTVKPWFNGKLDFSPPVLDLAPAGFPLLGGRLDYIAQQKVAVLIYGRRKHVIDLYIWPSSEREEANEAVSVHGYNVIGWKQGGMTLRAVSDLNVPELRQFELQFRH